MRSTDYAARFGFGRALWRFAWRMQRPVLGYQRLVCLVREVEASRPVPAVPAGMRCVEMPLQALAPLAATPGFELKPAALERAKAAGHRCIGIFDGSRLASFSLNATAPAWLDSRHRFAFPPGWTYHYMALTLPEWRGKRLHAAQFPAIEALVPGTRGIVTLVNSANLGSLASFERMGFREVGGFRMMWSPRRPTLIGPSRAGDFAVEKRSGLISPRAR